MTPELSALRAAFARDLEEALGERWPALLAAPDPAAPDLLEAASTYRNAARPKLTTERTDALSQGLSDLVFFVDRVRAWTRRDHAERKLGCALAAPAAGGEP